MVTQFAASRINNLVLFRRGLYYHIMSMKKTIATSIFFSIFFMLTTFVLRAQERATVTVTIKSLKALSSDACGDMDFFAKIHIGGKLKTFPIREGNNITVNWQFAATTDLDSVTTLIEIWDDDAAFCGDGDDEVCVSGNSKRVVQKFSTREYKNENFSSYGTCTRGGTENAQISYNINIVPVKTKTELLTQRNWKLVDELTTTGTGLTNLRIIPSYGLFTTRACKKDDRYVFRTNARYEVNEGATKCSPASLQVIKTGTWSFQINETKIQLAITGSSSYELFSLVRLDESILKLSSTYSSEGTIYHKMTTYIH